MPFLQEISQENLAQKERICHMARKKDRFGTQGSGKRGSSKKAVGPSGSSQQKRRLYAEVTIGALTGEISAEHLYDPPTQPYRGSTSHIWPLEKALEDLVDGGYVIDLRPLADHPALFSWVYRAPMPNGRLEGHEIDRLSEEVRQCASGMAGGLQGDFQKLALLMANRIGEPIDESAGPFDSVSVAYRAAYWGSRGALIGNTLYWSDGRQQMIGDSNTQKAMLPSPRN
jgi:hypothetical protein